MPLPLSSAAASASPEVAIAGKLSHCLNDTTYATNVEFQNLAFFFFPNIDSSTLPAQQVQTHLLDNFQSGNILRHWF